jgi:hypothetical protein
MAEIDLPKDSGASVVSGTVSAKASAKESLVPASQFDRSRILKLLNRYRTDEIN